MPGPQLIELAGERALIMHGDELCLDDHGYQRLRRVVRNPAVQWTYLHLPRSLRQRIAGRLRAGSTASQEQKLPEIMDVNQRAVAQTMNHFGVTLLIHGHTHRPAIHEFELGNVRARRIVLGDWYTQGSMLSWSGAGPQLLSIDYA